MIDVSTLPWGCISPCRPDLLQIGLSACIFLKKLARQREKLLLRSLDVLDSCEVISIWLLSWKRIRDWCGRLLLLRHQAALGSCYLNRRSSWSWHRFVHTGDFQDLPLNSVGARVTLSHLQQAWYDCFLVGYRHCYAVLNYYGKIYVSGVPAECRGFMG